MLDWQASFSILAKQGVLLYIMRGVLFTLVISVCAVVVSIFIGSLLGLMRNYCTGRSRPLKWLATGYIELFRNTPLLFWLFICLVFCPVPGFFTHRMLGLTSVEVRVLFRAFVALVLFESSIMAEIIRGGLNSVANGQFEAGHSQGFQLPGQCGRHRNYVPGAPDSGHLQYVQRRRHTVGERCFCLVWAGLYDLFCH